MPRVLAARLIFFWFFAVWPGAGARAEVKRIVIIKVDGVPQEVLDRELGRTDPVTNKSALPWMDRVFRQQGSRLANFYVRGISLSAPSWSEHAHYPGPEGHGILTIQDHPLQIGMESLIWQERMDGPILTLGSDPGQTGYVGPRQQGG